MPDYKKMYFKLFCACSKAIEILQQATLETEEIAMTTKDSIVLATHRISHLENNESSEAQMAPTRQKPLKYAKKGPRSGNRGKL